MKDDSKAILWCDASTLALGVCLDVDEQRIEDASWLREVNDCRHINLVELEAVVKRLNLAIAWGFSDIELRLDSQVVCGWISNVIDNVQRNKLRRFPSY